MHDTIQSGQRQRHGAGNRVSPGSMRSTPIVSNQVVWQRRLCRLVVSLQDCAPTPSLTSNRADNLAPNRRLKAGVLRRGRCQWPARFEDPDSLCLCLDEGKCQRRRRLQVCLSNATARRLRWSVIPLLHRSVTNIAIGALGHPHKTSAGEMSIRAVELPKMLAPCLHQLPDNVIDEETLSRRSHLKMRADRKFAQNLRLRSSIEAELASQLRRRGMIQVRTPILAGTAGGATAQPFETTSTALSGEKLTLRIAPELFLKRLTVGGMSNIFEIGPAFRNEGRWHSLPDSQVLHACNLTEPRHRSSSQSRIHDL